MWQTTRQMFFQKMTYPDIKQIKAIILSKKQQVSNGQYAATITAPAGQKSRGCTRLADMLLSKYEDN